MLGKLGRTCILFLVLGLLVSCTYVWNTKFEVPKSDREIHAMGWKIEPKVSFYRNIAADTLPFLDHYNVTLDAVLEKPERVERISSIDVDTIWITFLHTGERHCLIPYFKYWLSYSSEDELVRVFSFIQTDGSKDIVIPKSVDTILIEFDAILTEGKLGTKVKYTVDHDTVIVDDSIEAIRAPVRFKMYRHDTKSRVPAFFGK